MYARTRYSSLLIFILRTKQLSKEGFCWLLIYDAGTYCTLLLNIYGMLWYGQEKYVLDSGIHIKDIKVDKVYDLFDKLSDNGSEPWTSKC